MEKKKYALVTISAPNMQKIWRVLPTNKIDEAVEPDEGFIMFAKHLCKLRVRMYSDNEDYLKTFILKRSSKKGDLKPEVETKLPYEVSTANKERLTNQAEVWISTDKLQIIKNMQKESKCKGKIFIWNLLQELLGPFQKDFSITGHENYSIFPQELYFAIKIYIMEHFPDNQLLNSRSFLNQVLSNNLKDSRSTGTRAPQGEESRPGSSKDI